MPPTVSIDKVLVLRKKRHWEKQKHGKCSKPPEYGPGNLKKPIQTRNSSAITSNVVIMAGLTLLWIPADTDSNVAGSPNYILRKGYYQMGNHLEGYTLFASGNIAHYLASRLLHRNAWPQSVLLNCLLDCRSLHKIVYLR